MKETTTSERKEDYLSECMLSFAVTVTVTFALLSPFL